MTKDEILAKSRQENQNRDIFESEVIRKAQRIGGLIALSIAFCLIVCEMLGDVGMNYGYFLMILSAGSALCLYKGIRLHRRKEIVMAILFGTMTVYALVMYIMTFGKAV